MPRHRKPLEQRILDGTYNPRKHGPLPDDIGTHAPPVKPAHLTGDAAAFWDTITGLLKAIVRDRDAPLLEEMCWHHAELRRIKAVLAGKQPGEPGYNQLLVAVGICTDKFDKIAARFGMTPADRAKINADAAGPVASRVASRPQTKLDQKGPPK